MSAVLITLYLVAATLAKPLCPVWGHMYPKAGVRALSTHQAIQQASQSLPALIQKHIDGTEGGGGGGASANYSYAIEVFTVLVLLAVVGEAVWNDSITKYVPELAALVEKAADVPAESTWSPDWEEITIGALAGQTSGIRRDLTRAPLNKNADLA
ncbi:hypothetical protein MCOR25_004830 [Pyricularia grisea]|nr:hypothetical protein MCOR25_004830 [Pyricularia grisea]